ncbi:hypothetical protein HYFRA_00005784 [Hymenoscyphus fraxineus]|uniref:Uncharacterized protein n=1 Tax=Hymenoscyphus fraxineus TaxID=746836 RepID=A0A9N9KXY8_9HELO|nr:hypothetical protein HYFRA_00005784 [Hymenoscyphus fraxineus]
MAPPSAFDLFCANNQTPILIGAFATQVAHHQYIKKTTPAIASINTSFHIPRPLKAGLGWGVVFIGLLTQITIAKQAVRNHADPVLAHSRQRKPWKRNIEEGL